MADPSQLAAALRYQEDRISPTPRNKLLGMVADAMQGVGDWATSPERGGPRAGFNKAIADVLGLPGTQRTIDALSYGHPLGKAGSGGMWQPKSDTVDAVFNAIPLTGLASKGAKTVGQTLAPTAKEMARVAIEKRLANTGGVQYMLAPKGSIGRHLEGMDKQVLHSGKMEPFSTDQRLVDLAERYMSDKGLPYTPQKTYAELDVERAKRLADAYQKMQHDPDNPVVKHAYSALAKETQDQYEALLKAGYKFDFIRGADKYGGLPRNTINDVVANKHMSVFPSSEGFGGPASASVDVLRNPLLAKSDLRIGNDPSTTYNDLFRAVHDVFGHSKHGVGFRAGGEENAFQAHSRMFSKDALPAAASETRGQNSWVNFGPFAGKNRIASALATEYAPQKTGLLGPWAWTEGLVK